MARRILLWTAGSLAALLVLGVGAGVWTVRRPFPQTGGAISLDVLDGPVEVLRDDRGIPTVVAATTADLFRAQGFVHAQDRFFEMDFRRHVTAGRLSELFGEDQLDTDRFVRTLGWRRVAEREWELLADDTRTALTAYAEGVNAYLGNRDTSDVSLEYSVLGLLRSGYEPQPWDPVDSLAWLKAMAWDLRSNLEDELWRALVAAEIGVTRTEQLYPPYPHDRHPTIVREGAVVDGSFVPDGTRGEVAAAGAGPVGEVVSAAREPLAALAERLSSLHWLLGPPGTGLGSNSWVVSGGMTESGLPLLANDPHLGPSMPSIWYQMQLRCEPVGPSCPYAVGGFTFSGVPGVVIGHTDRVAWGFTNLGPDVADLFVERVAGDRYEFRGEWREMETITETIRVAGGEDVEHTVRLTRHGPVLSDVSETYADVAEGSQVATEDGREDHAVSLAWTALEPGRTADAITRLNRARDFEDFRAAAALFEVPAQNLVYADVDGRIGYQAPGRIPIRAAGDGRYPAPGWTGTHEWTATIPFEALPWSTDPEQGYIVTANQPAIGRDDEPFLGADSDYGFRAARIDELLRSAGDDLTVQDMTRLQMDAHHPAADFLVPLLLEQDVPARVEPSRRLLDGWDGQQARDSAAAAYFNAVWRHVLRSGFNDELPSDQQMGTGDRAFEAVRTLPADDAWWDDVRTSGEREDRVDILQDAMIAAHDELSERLGGDVAAWRWGELHTLTAEHQSFGQSGIGPVEWLFNRGPVATSGGTDAVNATAWLDLDDYEVGWVPSMRMVVDLADLDASRWVHLTGQSGHAFHPTYDDQLQPWADGETLPWPWTLEAVREAGTDVLTLESAG